MQSEGVEGMLQRRAGTKAWGMKEQVTEATEYCGKAGTLGMGWRDKTGESEPQQTRQVSCCHVKFTLT